MTVLFLSFVTVCESFSQLPDELILGGDLAESEEFPWMVFII